MTFSPGLISSVITLLLFPVFVYLGFWQLHRMEEKQAMQLKIEHYESQASLIFDTRFENEILKNHGTASFFDTTTTNEFRYQKLQVRGQFINYINFLLDNQIYNGRVGYAVLTAFQIENSPSFILVNRGWIPRVKPMSRKIDKAHDTYSKQYQRSLPNIEPIHGKITLIGMINRPSNGIILNSNSSIELPEFPSIDSKDLSEKNPSQAFLIQNIDFKELSGIVSNLLLPILLQLPKESPYAFDVLPIDFSQNISRHLGYAVQWFSIALASLIYYLVINTRSGKV